MDDKIKKVMALVHGELSQKKMVELVREMEKDADLKAIYERMLEMDTMLKRWILKEDLWKMDEEQRTAMLKALETKRKSKSKEPDEEDLSASVPKPAKSKTESKIKDIHWKQVMEVAACVGISLLLAGWVFKKSVFSPRASAEKNEAVAYYAEDDPKSASVSLRTEVEKAPPVLERPVEKSSRKRVDTKPVGQSVAIQKKLDTIIIPRIDFEDATLEAAINQLQLLVRDSDPEAEVTDKGLNMVIRRRRMTGASDVDAIEDDVVLIPSLRLQNVPASEVLRQICLLADPPMRYKVEDYVVAIVPATDIGEDYSYRELEPEDSPSDDIFGDSSVKPFSDSFEGPSDKADAEDIFSSDGQPPKIVETKPSSLGIPEPKNEAGAASVDIDGFAGEGDFFQDQAPNQFQVIPMTPATPTAFEERPPRGSFGNIVPKEESKRPIPSGELSFKEIAKLEKRRREADGQRGDQFIHDAREEYKKRNFQESVDLYTRAIATLPAGRIVDRRREFLKESLAQASIELSKTMTREGDVAGARQTLEDVLKVDPSNVLVEDELQKASDPIRVSGLDIKYTRDVDKVRRNLYKAEGYYNLGKFDEAHEELDRVLRIDPYNMAARRWQSRIDAERRDYYRSAYDETRARLLTEVDKAWEIVPTEVPDHGAVKVKPDPKGMVTRAFPVPPDFVERLGGGLSWGGASADDIFGDPAGAEGEDEGPPTLKELLEMQGVKFSKGAEVIFDKDSAQLIVRNDEVGIDQVSKITEDKVMMAEQKPSQNVHPGMLEWVKQKQQLETQIKNTEGEISYARAKGLAANHPQQQATEDRLLKLDEKLKQHKKALANLANGKVSSEGEEVLISSEPTHEIKDLTDETTAQKDPFSTFSLHVSDVSFKLAKSSLLERGQLPDRNKIRPEEFVNAFDYGDPSVQGHQKVACFMEQALHPFMQQRNLMRVSMSTAALGRSKPLRLTILLDNSGSMERADREASVLKAMEILVEQLQSQDQVSLISFAQKPRIMAEALQGEQLRNIVDLVGQAPSEGGTNMEEALRLAGQLAKRHQAEGSMSRIVLITDGAANLGNAEPEELGKMIVELRQQGVAFDACGVGANKLDDAMLEALARKGDGRYYLLDKPEDADEGFVKQLAGALRPAASNVKVQVKFNPDRVKNYKLLGFEKHLLKKDDFRDDAVDAAEMASQEAGSAMYQFQVLADGKGEVGEVFVRFRDMNTGEMVERSWTIPYLLQPRTIENAAPSMQLATTAAMLAEKMRNTDVGLVDFSDYGMILGSLNTNYASDQRVQDLIRMVRKVTEK